MNRNGFTFLTVIFMVMIVGIMLGLTGQSWRTVMKREREKELLFRGSQIKEAIENWYDPKYTVRGVKKHKVIALMDLNLLLEDSLNLKGNEIIYLPQHYATKLDDKNPKCAPDCPKQFIYQDPMTGKEWDVIKCDVSMTGYKICMDYPGNNTIIGVASKSNDEPLKTDFKDTALENMGTVGIGAPSTTPPVIKFGSTGAAPSATAPGTKMTKYSEWKFIADLKNDHKLIYKAYHEGW
jgi:type II secretory pathway pseudopilin PulG